MSGANAPYNVTKQDVRKMESEAATRHGGNIPSDSDAAQMQVCISSLS